VFSALCAHTFHHQYATVNTAVRATKAANTNAKRDAKDAASKALQDQLEAERLANVEAQRKAREQKEKDIADSDAAKRKKAAEDLAAEDARLTAQANAAEEKRNAEAAAMGKAKAAAVGNALKNNSKIMKAKANKTNQKAKAKGDAAERNLNNKAAQQKAAADAKAKAYEDSRLRGLRKHFNYLFAQTKRNRIFCFSC
jgi:colicin import membrane protein